jgi:KDO2-lipid IV(A) lauroyltransferase
LIFKILGLKLASSLGSVLGKILGPIFRSKNIINKNLKICFKNITEKEIHRITNGMWSNIGRTFAEYIFLKKIRKDKSLFKINGLEILEEIKKNNEPVIFVSAHLANFELMAMQLDLQGIKLATIYRPLNNFFLNPLMEYLRIKYICPVQIKKGRQGMKKILKRFKNQYSIALMVDQRLSEGEKVNFFNCPAYTTTIPAQMKIRFKCKIVPIYLDRINELNFEMTVHKPIEFENLNEKETTNVTLQINKIIEKMILLKPELWTWSHNRWK